MTYYDWLIIHSEVILWVSQQVKILIHQRELRVGSLLELQNSSRAPALDRTRAQKTLSNPNGFRQSFRAQATPRTPNKPGSPLALRTSPLSTLQRLNLEAP
jgi:hypothetical protein